MKKIFLSVIVVMLAVMPIMADNDRIVTREELPEKAQMFLSQHFANADVLYAKAERDMGVITSYDVLLDGDVKVEFNRSGEWTKVDCERTQVPDEVLPQGVLDYVKKKFAKAYVVEIEKNLMGYDVKLNNDLDLEFNTSGKFVRVD